MRGMLFSLLCQQALKRQGRPSGLIGQYKPYLNSNDSPTRDILKDYSGNGHDIQLYNFDFAENSGYGLYVLNLTNNVLFGQSTYKISSIKLHLTKWRNRHSLDGTFIDFGWFGRTDNSHVQSCKVKVSGLDGTYKLYYFYMSETSKRSYILLENGINILPESLLSDGTVSNNATGLYVADIPYDDYPMNLTVKLIPDYKGALVSDGVDDYGLCENFPILTKEKGYTVCAIRKILKPFEEIQANACLLSNYNNAETGSFYIENRANNSWSTYSFGGITNSLDVDYNNDFVFQTSLSYNNYHINKGENTNSINRLYLFRLAAWISSCFPSALYALEIYDHDLTDEEIEKVKEAMYEEYLTATNALQNHIIADYECYDKTNEDEDRDVLKDLSGNGHDITLYNFGFAEGSGYGLYSVDMNSISYKDSDKSYRLNYNTFNLKGVDFPVIRFPVTSKNINFTINVSIKNEYTTNLLDVYYIITGKPTTFLKRALENGINNISYVIPEEDEPTDILIAWRDSTTNVDVDIEFIPEYQGALVSDGVDDYGICNNFPILNKEDGYTVLAIRKILNAIDVNSCFINQGDSKNWSFAIDLFYLSIHFVRNWGDNIGVGRDTHNDLFVYQNSKTYNGIKDLTIGDREGLSQDLNLFALLTNYLLMLAALYALKIFDRDLTDEEIAYEKKKMIQRYEEKTGNKYVEQ